MVWFNKGRNIKDIIFNLWRNRNTWIRFS